MTLNFQDLAFNFKCIHTDQYVVLVVHLFSLLTFEFNHDGVDLSFPLTIVAMLTL